MEAGCSLWELIEFETTHVEFVNPGIRIEYGLLPMRVLQGVRKGCFEGSSSQVLQ